MKKLRELLAAKLAELRALLDGAEAESRNLTDEERESFDALETEVGALKERIARHEKLTGWESDQGDADTVAQPAGQEGRSHRPEPTVAAEGFDHAALEEQRELAFRGWLRGGFALPHERQACEHLRLDYRSAEVVFNFLPAEQRTTANIREHEQRIQTTDVPSGGGFLVPVTPMARFDKARLRFGGLRNFAEVITTATGEPLTWPGANDTGNQGRLISQDRTTDVPQQDVAFTEQTWYSHLYSSDAIPVSHKLLRDSSIDLEGLIMEMMGERLGRITAAHYATGTGTGQPEGLESGSVLGVTAASALSFTANELEDLAQSVDPEYRMGGQYLVHDSTRSTIGKMLDGNGRYLFRGANESTESLIVHGWPVRVDQGLDAGPPASGEQSVFFGDLSAYKIRDVSTMRFKRDESLFVLRDQVIFVAFAETDGKVLTSGGDPIKHIVH